MPYFARLKEELKDNRFRRECSPEELKKLEETLNLKLPESYREYMLFCGNSRPWFFSQYITNLCGYYDNFLEMRTLCQEAMDESYPGKFILPANALVFQEWQGYKYYFFLDNEGDDPPVYLFYAKCWNDKNDFKKGSEEYILARDQENGIISKCNDSFSEYINFKLDKAIKDDSFKSHDYEYRDR